MLGKTVLLATRALLVLAKEPPGTVMSPRSIAVVLNESPAYMAKVVRLLVRAGILRAEKGVKGGVFLSRQTADVTLLEVVEACQGTFHGSYCQPIDDPKTTCAFHRAAVELERAMVGVLSAWTLARMERLPGPVAHKPGEMHCLMAGFPAAITSSPRARRRRRGASA